MEDKSGITAYCLYSKQARERRKVNPLEEVYPKLPDRTGQDRGRFCVLIRLRKR